MTAFSRSTELAVWATLYLARRAAGGPCPIREIAEETGLPVAFLAKVIQRLVAAGLVRGFRGPGGGVELARRPKAITLGAVVGAVEDRLESQRCVLGFRDCSEDDSCPLHSRWSGVRGAIDRVLEQTTLEDLARGLRDVPPLTAESWARATRTARPALKKRSRRPSRRAAATRLRKA